MKQIQTALAAVLFAIVLPAQSDAAKPTPAGLDELTADWKAANKAYRAKLAEIRSSDDYKAAAEAEDRAKQRSMTNGVKRPDAKAFGNRALELADKHSGENTVAVLVYIANNLYDREVFAGMIDRVEKSHVGSPNLDGILGNGMLLASYVGAEKIAALLTRITEENENAQPRAWAMYWQWMMVMRDKDASDDDKARAETLLAKAEKLAAGTVLADKIAGPRFQKERLQIGMEAPDIEGVDTQGVAFKLSDYRGKVVVLDFWGFW